MSSLPPAEEGSPLWTGELDYRLPADRIAQEPAGRREASRLMVVDRSLPGEAGLAHTTFGDIGAWLPEGALLVVNDSRVFPARLRGRKSGSGGGVEALLLERPEGSVAPAMVRSSKPMRVGQTLEFDGGATARVASGAVDGRVLLDFAPETVGEVLDRCGELPLPPYIERKGGPTAEDRERYQTVYADSAGSVAAPTAGLHFTEALLEELGRRGFALARLTLHVGPGTFTPVRGGLDGHRMEEEAFEIGEPVAAAIAAARAERRPVVAVGTTTVRALESAAREDGTVEAGRSRTALFIRPGHRFRVVDALVTNFHLPGSTLLALVMALAGRERTRAAYEVAVREGYRFYSYGDAMLVR